MLILRLLIAIVFLAGLCSCRAKTSETTSPPPVQHLVALPKIEPAPGKGEVNLKWRTGQEVQVAGYNVMRSDAETGPFKEVNGSLIPAAARPDGPHSYEFTDTGLTAGATYYYYLEELLKNGIRRPLSDPMPVVATQRQERIQ